MASIARSLGQFGSDVGAGYDINLGWRERQQQMALEQARQKIAQMMAPLQLQELQTRIRQMQQPQGYGVEKLPGGGLGGITFDPATGTYSIKTLVPGQPAEPKFATLQSAAAYYLQKGDWEKLAQVNAEIEKTRAPSKPTAGGYTDTKTDTQGRLWGFNKDTNQYEIIPTRGAKFPVPHEGAGTGPGDIDALVWDIALGRQKMPPPGKFGAAVEARMKQLGITPPKVEGIPKDLQAQTDKLEKVVSQLSGIQGMNFKDMSPDDSLSLARAADAVTGSTARTAELGRLGGHSLMGLRWNTQQSYDENQAKSIYQNMASVLNSQIKALLQQYKKLGLGPPEWLQEVPTVQGAGSNFTDLGGKPH